jgi:uncharacterized protein (TIGR02646 family)
MIFVDRNSVVCPEHLKNNGTGEIRRAREQAAGGNLSGFAFSAYSHASVKEALRALFGGLCAYCEAPYDATQPEDVEHYRPKGRINTGNGAIVPGYWWLAATWDNLLPSCIDCNRERTQVLFDGTVLMTGKGDRFPLDDERQRARKEGEHANEQPLLLDPCVDDPSEFIIFREKSQQSIVVPKVGNEAQLAWRRARTSIDVYGLNRTGLVRRRSAHLREVKAWLGVLRRRAAELDEADPAWASRIEGEIADAMERLVDLQSVFTGMVRAVIEPTLSRLGLGA